MSLAEALKRVSLATFPIPVELSSSRLQSVNVEQLRIKLVVPDRDTGEPRNVYSIHDFKDYDGYLDGMKPEDWVRERVVWMLRHELDEHFLVDGVRVRDPHAGEEPTAL